MYLEQLLQNKSSKAELEKALSILYNIGFFPALFELGHLQTGKLPTENIMEAAAVQCGFSSGYFQCVQDILHFKEKYIDGTVGKKVPDYGAVKVLKDLGYSDKDIEDARQQSRSNIG